MSLDWIQIQTSIHFLNPSLKTSLETVPTLLQTFWLIQCITRCHMQFDLIWLNLIPNLDTNAINTRIFSVLYEHLHRCWSVIYLTWILSGTVIFLQRQTSQNQIPFLTFCTSVQGEQLFRYYPVACLYKFLVFFLFLNQDLWLCIKY